MYTIYTRRDIPDARHDPKCGGNPRDGHEKCLIYTQGQHRRVTRTCTRYVHVGTNRAHDVNSVYISDHANLGPIGLAAAPKVGVHVV